jgi:5-methylcytosine-specific restriction protein A
MSPAPSVCSTPHCMKITPRGRCEDCRKSARRQSDRRRDSSGERGYDAKWRRTRARFLYLNPWCSEPGCCERATEVHHVDGEGPSGPNGHKHAFLRGFCKKHHDQRTAKTQPGGWNG